MAEIIKFPGPKKRSSKSKRENTDGGRKDDHVVKQVSFEGNASAKPSIEKDSSQGTKSKKQKDKYDTDSFRSAVRSILNEESAPGVVRVDQGRREFIESLFNTSVSISEKKLVVAMELFSGMETDQVVAIINNSSEQLIQTKPTYFFAALRYIDRHKFATIIEKIRNLTNGDAENEPEDK